MKPRILVIDDEAAIRDSLKMILEYEDYEFLGAASGPEGVATVKREAPDLVVLDIKMPGMNGLEALAEIRKVDESVPVSDLVDCAKLYALAAMRFCLVGEG